MDHMTAQRPAWPERLTDLVARRQVLVLVAGIPLLAVQQQEVDHLLLVFAAERRETKTPASIASPDDDLTTPHI